MQAGDIAKVMSTETRLSSGRQHRM